MIQAYFDQIKSLLDRHATLPVTVGLQVNFELRPGDQGYVTGLSLYIDGSELFFREYLDGAAGDVEKLMYSYHYQNGKQALIFRYDNAIHRPSLTILAHKHTQASVMEAAVPGLETVLEEILAIGGWVKWQVGDGGSARGGDE